jgi:hypothetical protein
VLHEHLVWLRRYISLWQKLVEHWERGDVHDERVIGRATLGGKDL